MQENGHKSRSRPVISTIRVEINRMILKSSFGNLGLGLLALNDPLL